jgi:uncharacterized membrane protein
MNSQSKDHSSEELFSYLKSLDERISKIEQKLQISVNYEAKELLEVNVNETILELSNEEKEERLEFQIGQFWLAKLGILIFFIGVAFLMSFPFRHIPVIVDILFGYTFSIVVFFISHNWRERESFSYLSDYLLGGGLFLFYFTTLRMKFFGNDFLISQTGLEVILLSITIGIILWISITRKSNYLILVSLTLGYVTALVSDNPYSIFGFLTLLAVLSVYFKLRYNWKTFLYVGIVLTYFTHLLWFMNNPVLGNTLQAVTGPGINLLFLLVYSIIFAAGTKLRKDPYPEDTPVVFGTILNAGGCYSLFFLISYVFNDSSASFYHLLASITFLSIAIIFWQKEQSKFSTFIYAMLGYFALTVAIIYEVKSPGFYILLCWQSLIVLSTAVWFRSKYIVLANFVIYILIFITYLALEGKISSTSLSFGIVALLSARILNWKKDRLELTTEQMRNAYLLTALVIIPYALYHAMPSGWASVSWIVVAIIYYFLSVLLKSKKYRWMALLTLGLTVVYVFIIGITNEDFTYKIISFLVLGFVMLIISILYTRKKKKETKS